MAFSLSLLRHSLAARNEGARAPAPDDADRPEGTLLWLHLCPGSPTKGTALVIGDLKRRFPDLHLMASGSTDWLPDDTIIVETPADTRNAARAFLDHWTPDIAVFSGPDPFPMIWSDCRVRGTALLAIEADPARHPVALIRPLEHFLLVHAGRDDPRLQGVVRQMTGLATAPSPPSAIESDLEDMTGLLASRPVWLAAGIPRAEEDIVLAAHAEAAQLAHRLLLILELKDVTRGAELSDKLQERGVRTALRSAGEEPEDQIQVLLADEPGELGLWARLASITYLGGTLRGDDPCDPAIPAALGSVVIHGPLGGAWQRSLAELDSAQGAQIVLSGDALGRAVEQMLVPDRAAAIAHRAWDVLTHGAAASHHVLTALDRAVRAVQDRR